MQVHIYNIWGYVSLLELFFNLASKWLKWCAQTLHPFSQILKILCANHSAT